MGAINKVKPSFFGATRNKGDDIESTIALGTVQNPEATLATVMMTGIHDTREQTQFNRLMLMAEDDTVAETYPLTRKLTHVGRSRRNHVRLKDPLVSTRHLSVSVSDGTCVINDLDSSNGTFLNGERLSGGRVLKDGDEVMLGKTILRFTARQSNAAAGPKKAHRNPVVLANRKRVFIRVATVLCIVVSATIIFMQTHNAASGPAAHGPALAAETPEASPPASEGHASAPQTPVEADKATDGAVQPEPPSETTHIQRALADYAAGLLYNARQTLKMLSTAGEVTPEALAARRTLSMIGTVQELHAQALEAQAQKKYTRALEYWDRLLLADMELVGDRPSFFAMQAEQKVQSLSYEYALEAYRLKNFRKARQLCRVILKINPKNQEALALLAKIDPKA